MVQKLVAIPIKNINRVYYGYYAIYYVYLLNTLESIIYACLKRYKNR